jgi:hypothetical protein
MPDNKIPTPSHLSALRTKELLAIGSRSAKAHQNWLLEVGDYQLLEMLLTDMCSGTSQSGAALLDTVCSPDTPLDALVHIKDIAKGLTKAAHDPSQEAAGMLLYHLSVASALGFHEQNISSMDAAARLPLYRELVAEICDDQVSAVFEKALDRMTSPRT